jgi:SAM-dependent methyltransferase
MDSTLAAPTSAPRPEWFASWFDSPHYRTLYAHRDAAEAAALIDRVHPAPGSAVLDLGCGTGRHARQLAANGLDVTGLDLSAESLSVARRDEHQHLRFIRRDMRAPFGDRTFDGVYNLFTSFGYFDDPADNLTVVQNIARALKPGGRLVLDYLNVGPAAVHLRKEETIARDDVTYRITRSVEAGFFVKRITIDDRRLAKPIEHVERVARLTRADFEFMFALVGLGIEAVFGDYRLRRFDAEASPRLILVATPTARARDRASAATGSCVFD